MTSKIQKNIKNEGSRCNFDRFRSKDKITFGTWNVETLWRDGRLDELCHELKHYKWNVIGLSEVRRKALGEINSDDGHKLFYCGRDDKHEHGVGFLVHRDTAKSVVSCNFISSRFISIRIKASPFNITLLQAYAPTSDYSDEDIKIFYQDIQENFDKAQKKDIKIILGDFNARVGKDTAKDWPKQQGPHCNVTTNDRGLRLLEFANYNDLVIANTLGKHKKSRTMTRHHPNGVNHGQIDYILVPNRFKSSVYTGRTRTFPRPDVASPHDRQSADCRPTRWPLFKLITYKMRRWCVGGASVTHLGLIELLKT